METVSSCGSRWQPLPSLNERSVFVKGDGILGDAMSDSANGATSEASPAAEAAVTVKQTLDITEIMAILPHRYPFLLIDRVLEMERKKRIVAIKNVTANEPQFTGHFPDYPILPGVMTIEAMAQAGGALLLTEVPDRENKLMVFTGIDKASFRRPIVPGDQLRIEVTVLNWRSRIVKMQGMCTVEGEAAAEAVITCMLVPRPRKAGQGNVPAAGMPAGQ